MAMDDDNLFSEFEDDFLRFEQVEVKRCSRPDLHAFLLLNELCPGDCDMVCSAEHDEIWLDVKPEDLKAKATREQLRELHCCGVRDDDGYLCMFV